MAAQEKTDKSLQSLLALDIGERRIGVAIASLAARLARPYGTLENSPSVLNQIAEMVAKERAVGLVLGLPLSLNGGDTAQTRYVRGFAESLKAVIKIPVYWNDEALTSVQAEEELKSRGAPYNKADIDALAACYILADFIAVHQEEFDQ